MKFIFAVLALVFVFGCGQNNPPKNPAVTVTSVQPTPPPQSDVTKTDFGTSDVGSGAGNGPVNGVLAPPAASMIFAPPPVVPKTDAEIADENATAFAQQIGFQEKLLYQEQAALDKAIATKDKDVHLTADFTKMAAFGVGAGFLTWDFLKRVNVVDRNGWDYLKSVTRYKGRSGLSTMPEVGEESAVAAAAASRSATSTIGPAAAAVTEFVSAAVLGLLAVRSAVDLNKDRVIHFSTTEEIQYHDGKVREAIKNLADARANLRAIYFPPPKKRG